MQDSRNNLTFFHDSICLVTHLAESIITKLDYFLLEIDFLPNPASYMRRPSHHPPWLSYERAVLSSKTKGIREPRGSRDRRKLLAAIYNVIIPNFNVRMAGTKLNLLYISGEHPWRRYALARVLW